MRIVAEILEMAMGCIGAILLIYGTALESSEQRRGQRFLWIGIALTMGSGLYR